jgi:hypothetical protein
VGLGIHPVAVFASASSIASTAYSSVSLKEAMLERIRALALQLDMDPVRLVGSDPRATG